ncbi:hypothetical protein PUN28_002908 [Cardiocondyla obscurior]|uniref:Uncharacterized protein n=1 Tax=Cardiocondyla obscurior TaxID=286306 RepID=A0AAW2GWV1_9HYME
MRHRTEVWSIVPYNFREQRNKICISVCNNIKFDEVINHGRIEMIKRINKSLVLSRRPVTAISPARFHARRKDLLNLRARHFVPDRIKARPLRTRAIAPACGACISSSRTEEITLKATAYRYIVSYIAAS